MWGLFAVATMVFGSIAFIDLRPLYKKKRKSDMIAFLSVFSVAYVICSLRIFGVLQWNPVQWLINLLDPVSRAII